MTDTKKEYIEKVNPYINVDDVGTPTVPGVMKLSQDEIDLMRTMIQISIEDGKKNNNKYFVQKIQQFRDRFESVKKDDNNEEKPK